MKRKEALANVETHIAWYYAQMNEVPKEERHEGNSAYTIPRSRWTNTKEDLAFIKRGTNWRLVDRGEYPYNLYRYAIKPAE